MKKSIFKFVTVVGSLLILTNCKKSCEKFDTYFYSDLEDTDDSLSIRLSGPLTFYLDGENKGSLPNLKTRLAPNNDTILKNALYLSLEEGSYKLEAKDNAGNVKVSCRLKFKTNSISVSSRMGGQASSNAGKVIVTKLFY